MSATPTEQPEFTIWPDLASRALAGSVIWASDEAFAERENLIAANHTLEEMREILGVDSLGFLSVEGVKNIAEGCKVGLCTGCFTGKYPADPPAVTEKSKFESKIPEVTE